MTDIRKQIFSLDLSDKTIYNIIMKKCPKHPKYSGRKIPKHKCLTCLALYSLISLKPRLTPLPTKVVKSKKIYNRKKQDKID